MNESADPHAVEPIAIVGMACRFPGAPDLDTFWRKLRDGVESICFFSEAELQAAGVAPELFHRPNYVAAHGKLDGVEFFDADFFGFSPREAELMDPQHRLFLECAWAAVEHAGHSPQSIGERCGVIAGVGLNTYLINNLLRRPDLADPANFYSLFIASDKDFLATRVSYKLNLNGPSFGINTACSSSLVAVHLACQQLWSWQCNAVLAGGVALQTPQNAGYLHQAGGITSADGHCRAFDAAAGGTVSGSGVGVVVLKRLSDALADGDTVHALIRGTACNNDGADKAGYTAPSINGQAAVIAEAQAMADVAPESINYLEAHGTGTALGDPIEIAALNQAFASKNRQFCRIGSVKSNIGHLDTAAGIAGLIKTILALQHRAMPPSLHYTQANPQIDFAATPFVVNQQLTPWPRGLTRRRAAVSSFGIGGTNAHVILEEAPDLVPLDPLTDLPTDPLTDLLPHSLAGPQLCVVSARHPAALQRQINALADHLGSARESRPEPALADIAWTLAMGRRHFTTAAFAVADTPSELAAALRSPALPCRQRPSQPPRIAFLFPGQGAQQAGIGRRLYQTDATFRAAFDECARTLLEAGAVDVRPLLLLDATPAADEILQATENTQPLLFAFAIALMAWWRQRGIEPAAVLGHSAGEYAAAVAAGILSLPDAARALAARARLMSQLPPGAMAAVGLSAQALQIKLEQAGGTVSIAALNAPALCTVAGDCAAISALGEQLSAEGVFFRPLHTAHAFHSPAVASILADFRATLAGIEFSPPRLPFYSAVLGRLASASEITDRELWVQQIRQAVRFAPAVDALLADGFPVTLEAGPGATLSSLTRHAPQAANWTRSGEGNGKESRAKNEAKTQAESQPPLILAGLTAGEEEQRQLLQTLGQLWLAGADPHWPQVFATPRRRCPLPTYPFERVAHWVTPTVGTQAARQTAASTAPVSTPQHPLDDWFYVPGWRRAAPLLPGQPGDRWLLFADAELLPELLPELQTTPLLAALGGTVNQVGSGLAINPADEHDFDSLLTQLASSGQFPDKILFAWALTRDPLAAFTALLRLCRALARQGQEITELILLSRGMAVVHDGEAGAPLQACLMSTLRVIPQELPGLHCRGIDLPAGKIHLPTLTRELLTAPSITPMPPTNGSLVALRGQQRWLADFAPLSLPAPTAPVFRQGGAYLITGGLGGMGLLIAEHLARTAAARLVLVSRRALPPAADWESLAKRSAIAPKIRQNLADLESFLTAQESAIDAELAIRCIEDRPGLRAQGDLLSAALAVAYLQQQGLELKAGQSLPLAELYQRCQVLPEFHRLLRHLLNLLIEDGWLSSHGEALCVLRDFTNAPAVNQLLPQICTDFPALAAQFEMVATCVAQYPAALSGQTPAISVLYPDGQRYIITEAAERCEEHGNFRVYRTLLADLLQKLAQQAAGGRPLRILEIGGGNAIMTGLIAERLRHLNVEYHFTDIGPSFVQAAAAKARELGYDFMQFAPFDITRDPAAQGFALGSFDAVIGLDVVHATPSLRDTVANLRQLLAPGGLLGLVESARTERWNDMVWGLAEGWWYAQDTELRNPNSPLLSTERWEQALADSGHSALLALPVDPARRGRTDCSLILAQFGAPATARDDDLEEDIAPAILNTLLNIRQHASDLLVCTADVADATRMEEVVASAEARFGPLHGVIHAAAVEDKALIIRRTEPFAEAELRPKLLGSQVLTQVFLQRPLDFMVFCSSITGTIGGAGQIGYCAANAFLDALAEQRCQEKNELTVAIAWGRWQGVGLARHYESWHEERTGDALAGGMSGAEGIAALERILHHRIAPRVAVISADWLGVNRHANRDANADANATSTAQQTTASPSTALNSPLPEFSGSPLEQQLAAIWQQILGARHFDRDTTFQSLGGDSLVGIQLISRIKEQFAVQLPIHSIFDSPTIAALAERINAAVPAMEEGEI